MVVLGVTAGTLYTEGEDTPQSFLDFMVINHSMSYIVRLYSSSFLILFKVFHYMIIVIDTLTLIV